MDARVTEDRIEQLKSDPLSVELRAPPLRVIDRGHNGHLCIPDNNHHIDFGETDRRVVCTVR